MKRIGDIALFLQVLEHGSISAAARHMDLSPAVASQRLKRLEAELGLRLLHRTTRRLTPTPEGLALAEEGRPLLDGLTQLGVRLQQGSSQVSGLLRVTASAAFGQHYLMPLVSGFLVAHPQVQLRLDLDDRMVDLIAEGYDLAIRIGQLQDSSWVSRRLADNPRVLCASPDYLRRRGLPQQPADLLAHDCIVQSGQGDESGVWRLQDAQGESVRLRVHGRVQSNAGEALRQAALAGLGISRHSLWQVHEDLRAGRLQRVLPQWSLPGSGIHALMPERRLQPARVRMFVEYLADSLAHLPGLQQVENGG